MPLVFVFDLPFRYMDVEYLTPQVGDMLFAG